MKEIELCRIIINKVNSIQFECKEIISNTTKIVEAHSIVLDSCKANYKKIQNLQDICRELLVEVDKILDKIENVEPEEDIFKFLSEDLFLPVPSKAVEETTKPVNDKVEAALRCLSQLHIIGMSKQTILSWPFSEAPKALQEIAFAVGLSSSSWVAVASPEVQQKWLDTSPFKNGYGLKFSTGHEVIYGFPQ